MDILIAAVLAFAIMFIGYLLIAIGLPIARAFMAGVDEGISLRHANLVKHSVALIGNAHELQDKEGQ